MTSGIYEIEHARSGKRYVGSAVNCAARWNVHRFYLRRGTHHSEKLQRAWTKYGEHEFNFRRLLICSEQDLVFYEQRVLDAFDAVHNGFNCAPVAGSSLGYKHTAEALKKMSGRRTVNQYARGAVMSQETKDKIGASNRGKTRSIETLLKLRAARVGKRPALGMKHSVETRALLSKLGKRRKLSTEHKERLRLSRLGSKHSAETRARIGAASGAARLGKKRGPYIKTKRGNP